MVNGGYIDPAFIAELCIDGGGLYNRNRGYADTTGKTLRSLTINTAIRNAVLILAGQSNMGSEAPTAYTPTNSSVVDNFNIYDRQMYAAAGVLLGSSWVYQALGGTAQGHVGGRIADGLINAGKFDRVILVPVAIGATLIANWDLGGIYYDRISVAINRLVSVGITPSTTNCTWAVLWGQGESDNPGTSQATYDAAMRRIIDRTRAGGFSGRFLVAKQTKISGSTSAGIQAAQAAVVGHDASVYAGPDADAIGNRYPDNTHFDDTGVASYASAWVTKLAATGAPF